MEQLKRTDLEKLYSLTIHSYCVIRTVSEDSTSLTFDIAIFENSVVTADRAAVSVRSSTQHYINKPISHIIHIGSLETCKDFLRGRYA